MKNSYLKNGLMVLVLSVSLSSCAIMQGKSSPTQYTSDAATTTQIKTMLLRSDITSAPNIHVETQNGVVQMSGFVSSQSQVAEAQRIASSVNGVKGVINDLVVTPPASYKNVKNKSYQGS